MTFTLHTWTKTSITFNILYQGSCVGLVQAYEANNEIHTKLTHILSSKCPSHHDILTTLRNHGWFK